MNSRQEKPTLVYVLCSRYSGSTLLANLMAMHPKIASIGERRKFMSYMHLGNPRAIVCSCGNRFEQCPFWHKIYSDVKIALGDGFFSRDLSMRVLAINRRVNRLLKTFNSYLFNANAGWVFNMLPWNKQSILFNREIIKTVLHETKTNIFLDSSKMLDDLPFFTFDNYFDFKIVYLYKRPESQVNSELKKHKDFSLEKASQKFVKENSKIMHALKQGRAPVHIIDYEEFCNHPDNGLKQLFGFIETNHISPQDLLSNESKDLHIMGNRALRQNRLTKIEPDNSWMTQLSDSQKEDILTLTGSFYNNLNAFKIALNA